jgi:hypothetical protein
MEIMLGNWTDAKLRGFKVVEFPTMHEAMDLAYKYPDIDWNKLVSIHEDAFDTINKSVKSVLKKYNFIVELDSHLMDAEEIKNTMFDRVIKLGERYTMFYNANDVISINIINPWYRNLLSIADNLRSINELRIKQILRTKTNIILVGVTDVGTTYEIRLWTTMVSQWARWVYSNNLDGTKHLHILNNLNDVQNVIDSNSAVC